MERCLRHDQQTPLTADLVIGGLEGVALKGFSGCHCTHRVLLRCVHLIFFWSSSVAKLGDLFCGPTRMVQGVYLFCSIYIDVDPAPTLRPVRGMPHNSAAAPGTGDNHCFTASRKGAQSWLADNRKHLASIHAESGNVKLRMCYPCMHACRAGDVLVGDMFRSLP